ncbi:hypothetical protein [Aureimonas sp. AU40]|uniref:hypothetical protein n=1 Tax=Aureimonas sp. AU40 TaxID=1637747 RepID=UPI00078095F7|nr:hypothetical protein [Aureimonas sp. AU40]
MDGLASLFNTLKTPSFAAGLVFLIGGILVRFGIYLGEIQESAFDGSIRTYAGISIALGATIFAVALLLRAAHWLRKVPAIRAARAKNIREREIVLEASRALSMDATTILYGLLRNDSRTSRGFSAPAMNELQQLDIIRPAGDYKYKINESVMIEITPQVWDQRDRIKLELVEALKDYTGNPLFDDEAYEILVAQQIAARDRQGRGRQHDWMGF